MKKRLRIVITAGPTQEPIDPIRFISNHSSGTLGYTITKEAKKRHHRVTLISGPVNLPAPKGVDFIGIRTAIQMKKAVSSVFERSDCLIMTAAVSDYRINRISKNKINKTAKQLTLKLIKTPDILSEFSTKSNNKIIVGFCLETKNLRSRALMKLKNKKLDFIVANQYSPGANNPFGNAGKCDFLLIDRAGFVKKLKGISKGALSKLLLDKIEKFKLNVGV